MTCIDPRAKIEEFSIPEPNTGCWIWMRGHVGHMKYGNVSYKGRMYQAHRLSYEVFKGPIGPGKIVMHTCDVPSCVNPAHLREGTLLENNQDRDRKGRHRAVRGENCGTSKLTAGQVLGIRAQRVAGAKLKDIAKDYGIAICTVSAIVNRRLWAHI